MRVGTSPVKTLQGQLRWDHPHACGDKAVVVAEAVSVRGSSPCVWGQDSDKATVSSTGRIIPMRVGTREKL